MLFGDGLYRLCGYTGEGAWGRVLIHMTGVLIEKAY